MSELVILVQKLGVAGLLGHDNMIPISQLRRLNRKSLNAMYPCTNFQMCFYAQCQVSMIQMHDIKKNHL
jgi:hypothetical protein